MNEIDLDIPQHFTKEQSEWIKKYCIKRNIEFYNQALDDFINKVCTLRIYCNDLNITDLEEARKQLIKEKTL